jgi:hypothetical protein
MKVMNIEIVKDHVKHGVKDVVEYYKFKTNKNYISLEIGETKLDLENKTSINNNNDVFDDLKKVEKTYDIITCSKMNLNDFDYYMLLSRCVKLLKIGGIFLFDSSDCTTEFIKNKSNFNILEKTESVICMEKK